MDLEDKFFKAVDSDGLANRHALAVLNLEETQAGKLLKRYSAIRGELRDRLDRLKGDTFSAQQMRGTLVQIEAAIAAMNTALQEDMGEQGMDIAIKSIQDLESEIGRYDKKFLGATQPLNLDAAQIALDVKNFKLMQYKGSLEKYGSDLLSEITLQLSNSVLINESLPKVVMNLSQKFQTEEWKLLRIARTELHNTYALGKLEGMRETQKTEIPDLMKALYHPMDDRTGDDSKDLALKNPIVPVDQPFEHTYNGKKYVFMAPPQRPNDRAILIPYREEWAKNA